jgi:hypothetical protein
VFFRNVENRLPSDAALYPKRAECPSTLHSYTGLFKMIVGVLTTWPPRSPGATPCHFFVWGYVKDQVYVPPLPASIPELKVRIRTHYSVEQSVQQNIVYIVVLFLICEHLVA